MTKIRVFVSNSSLARMRTDATCMLPWFLETKYGAKRYKTLPRNKHVEASNCQTDPACMMSEFGRIKEMFSFFSLHLSASSYAPKRRVV